MEPERVRKWIYVFADLVVILVGAFMLLYGTTRVADAGKLTLLIGGGLTALGIPVAHRFDIRRRNGNGNGTHVTTTPEPVELSKDDRWSHLP